jgi:Fuc2NAc and GlcNAc transferase
VSAALLQGAIPDVGLLLVFCTAFAMLWALNLYNFMDGVDGIAGTQCFLACSAAALLAWSSGGASDYALFCLLFGFSHLGFLAWNWPAARLFMGDAGSIPTGFTLAALAVLGGALGYLSIACWLVLLAVFITDASWTLTQRIITGQKFTQAHRSHAYQRLSRYWGSHQAVVVLLILINAIWLFPLAWAIVLWPQYTIILVILAYLPLLVGMAKMPNIA